MKYKEGMVFHETRAGTTIQGVPLTHDIFWTALNRPRTGKWLKRMNEIKELTMTHDLYPVYYCKKCRQIEDGAHRIRALYENEAKTFDIKIFNKCHHNNSGYQGMLEAILTEHTKKTDRKFKPLDFRWIGACRDKWRFINLIVNFNNKYVLDVGCQTGYTPLEAIRRGAKYAKGIDTRWETLEVGRKAIERLGFDNVELELADWREFMDGKWDIVICMGLLHYFLIDEYETLFNKLLDAAKETLIIELRLTYGNRIDIAQKGGQTFPTEAWLSAHLNNHGFNIKKRHIRKPGRELWIARRK